MKNSVFFYILIRSWKSLQYFDRCVDSVLSQNYKNYKILFVDDNSGYGVRKKEYMKNKLKGHYVKFNRKRLYSLKNAFNLLSICANDDAVVFNLDGDDWLLDRDSLGKIARMYHNNSDCLLTYGECLLWKNGELSKKPSRFILPYANRSYPEKIIKNRLYREEPFYPLHPRTWKLSLFKKINKKDFMTPDGKWIRFAEDQAIFYPMLEMANGKFVVVKEPVYVHNFEHEYSDLKSNILGLVRDELAIRKKERYESQ